MPGTLSSLIVNLHEYPTQRVITTHQSSITVGDLHSNPLKMLTFLITHCLVDCPPLDYAQMVTSYRTLGVLQRILPDSKTTEYRIQLREKIRQLFNTFEALFDRLVVVSEMGATPLVRFLGDMLADRGHNDYLILLILKKMQQLSIRYEVLLSNHDLELILTYELGGYGISPRGQARPRGLLISSNQNNSLSTLCLCVQEGLLHISIINELIEGAYLPHVRMVSAEWDEGFANPTIYTHAPIGLSSLRNIANYLNVPIPQPLTLNHFSNLLMGLNDAIQALLREKKLHQHIKIQKDTDWQDDWDELLEEHAYFSPLAKFIWDRRPTNPHLMFDDHVLAVNVHGHIGAELFDSTTYGGSHHNLDGFLGRSDDGSSFHAVGALSTLVGSTIALVRPIFEAPPLPIVRHHRSPPSIIVPGQLPLGFIDEEIAMREDEYVMDPMNILPLTIIDVGTQTDDVQQQKPSLFSLFCCWKKCSVKIKDTSLRQDEPVIISMKPTVLVNPPFHCLPKI